MRKRDSSRWKNMVVARTFLRMSRRRSRQALTIVELLVVLAILAIIFAMLLPAHHGGGPSHSLKCLSNQKQVALGALMYAEDSKKILPNFDDLPGNDGPVALAFTTNYLKYPQVFMCPSVAAYRKQDRSWRQPQFVPELSAGFFRSNGNDYAYYDGIKSLAPSAEPLLADRFGWTNRTAWKGTTGKPNSPFHVNGRIITSFGDGHAEVIRPDRVLGTNYNPAWSAMQDPVLHP